LRRAGACIWTHDFQRQRPISAISSEKSGRCQGESAASHLVSLLDQATAHSADSTRLAPARSGSPSRACRAASSPGRRRRPATGPP
jgi:hypothetical protein